MPPRSRLSYLRLPHRCKGLLGQLRCEDFRRGERLPALDEHALGQLFLMLMLATVVEGRLLGINPYGQPGVESYKKHMTAFLRK